MFEERVTKWRVDRHLREMEKNPEKHADAIRRIAEKKPIQKSIDAILETIEKMPQGKVRENLSWAIYEHTNKGGELTEEHFKRITDILKSKKFVSNLAFAIYKYAENFGLTEKQKELVRSVIMAEGVEDVTKHHLSLLLDEIK